MMKKSINKLLALLLTLAMLTSAFAFATVSAEEAFPEWKVVSEDFDGDKINIKPASETLDDSFALGTPAIFGRTEVISMKNVAVVADPADPEGGNKVLQLQPDKTSKYRIIPNSFESDCFTFTFDFYFANETAAYNGFHVSADGDHFNHIFQVFDQAVPVRAYHHHDGAVTNAASGDIINAETWYTAKLVRVGTTITFTLVAKNAPETVLYNMSNTYDCLTATTAPRIFITHNTGINPDNASIYFDNYRLENTTGDVNCIGAQASAVADGKYAVRFIGALNTEAYAKAGFEVVASFGNGQSKTFKLDTCEGYTGIMASNGNEFFKAQELGGKLLIALSIKNIPTSVGEITFTVKALAYENGSANPIESDAVTVKALVEGNTVVLAKP